MLYPSFNGATMLVFFYVAHPVCTVTLSDRILYINLVSDESVISLFLNASGGCILWETIHSKVNFCTYYI